jgi:hypothetical protein
LGPKKSGANPTGFMLTDCQLLGGFHVFTLVENALDVVGITTVDDSNWNSHQQTQQEQLHSVDINQQTCGYSPTKRITTSSKTVGNSEPLK